MEFIAFRYNDCENKSILSSTRMQTLKYWPVDMKNWVSESNNCEEKANIVGLRKSNKYIN